MRFVTSTTAAGDTVIIIVDWRHYIDNAIDDWCADAFDYSPRVGMLLSFKSDADLNWFAEMVLAHF